MEEEVDNLSAMLQSRINKAIENKDLKLYDETVNEIIRIECQKLKSVYAIQRSLITESVGDRYD